MQSARLILLSIALWVVATAYIRIWPTAFTSPVMGAVGFATTFPMAWLSIRLIMWIGKLQERQLLVGVALVGTIAMMIDGAALRFTPQAYGSSDTVLRLGAAWLLWGYGISFGITVIWSAKINRSSI